jgi:uncharacterized protein
VQLGPERGDERAGCGVADGHGHLRDAVPLGQQRHGGEGSCPSAPLAETHAGLAAEAWRFQDYGPPGFVQILAADGTSPMGAIQQRRQLLDDGPTRGFECTFSVDDADEVRRRVVAAGGRILMEKFTITNMGHLIAFEDPGGNPVLAMQYDTAAQ